MRRKILRIAGWLHFTLVLASLIPAFYGLVFPPQLVFGWSLYSKCLMIIFPVIVTELAVQKTKNLGQYLVVAAAALSLTGIFAWLAGPAGSGDDRLWGYTVLMLVETVLLFISRFSVRVRKKEEYEAMQAGSGENATFAQFFQESSKIQDKPRIQFLAIFLVVYGLGLLLSNHALCNQAVFGMVSDTVLFLLYTYLEKTEEYLSLNQRVAGVPAKRIYGIGRTMFLLLLGVLALGLLPGILTSKYRNYQDIRAWSDKMVSYVDESDETDGDRKDDGEDSEEPLESRDYMLEQYHEPPRWLSTLGSVMVAVCCLFLLFLVGREIRQAFVEFRGSQEENGDIVENLTDEPQEQAEHIRHQKRKPQEKEVESLRKKYRRTIRKYRKDLPEPSETPTEIEERAGLLESAMMRELHTAYERERYGNHE